MTEIKFVADVFPVFPMAGPGRVQGLPPPRVLTAIENDVSAKLACGLIGDKCGGRNQKSALAARRDGLPEPGMGICAPCRATGAF